MSKDNIALGTCGWSYKEWEGNFYQIKSGQSKLRAYSRVFKTAEIDSTFYRNPTKGTVMGWLKYSPSDFIFTAKLPKTITHDNMLADDSNLKSKKQPKTTLSMAQKKNLQNNVDLFFQFSFLLLIGGSKTGRFLFRTKMQSHHCFIESIRALQARATEKYCEK